MLIEHKMVVEKLNPVLVSIQNRGGFEKLNRKEKFICSYVILKEISSLEEENLLTENFLSLIGNFLKSGGVGLASNAFSALIQTFLEPYLNSLFRGIGLPQGVANFLISALTENPGKLLRAIVGKDCRLITEIVVQSIIEALVMNLQKKIGLGGGLFDFLRNDILETIESTDFINKLTDKLLSGVCNITTKILDSIKNMDFKGLSSIGS